MSIVRGTSTGGCCNGKIPYTCILNAFQILYDKTRVVRRQQTCLKANFEVKVKATWQNCWCALKGIFNIYIHVHAFQK